MHHQLILASQSPRRRQLLREAGFLFDIFSVKVSENLEKNLTLDEQIVDIARRKAEASVSLYKPLKSQSYLFLSADTVVVLDNQVLGKPESAEQATEFLRALSGREHWVLTAVYLVQCQVLESDHPNLRQLQKVSTDFGLEKTKVNFRPISNKEILEYVESGEPMDKAGAYGIQGTGGRFVEKLSGPYDNVVGLPVGLFKKLLQKNSWQVEKK